MSAYGGTQNKVCRTRFSRWLSLYTLRKSNVPLMGSALIHQHSSPPVHGFTIGIVKDYCTRKLCLSASKNKRGCMLHPAHRIKALHAASSTSKEQRSMHIQRGRSHAFCNRYCDRIHTKEFSRRQRRRSYTIWLTRDSSMARTR